MRVILSVLALCATAGLAAADLPLEHLRLPAGFEIEVFADDVPNARSMVMGEQGTLFVGSRRAGRVHAISTRVGDDGQLRATGPVIVVAKGLNNPNGVAVRDGSLYVAEINRILRFDDIEARLDDPPKPVVVYDGYPRDKSHGWKYIAFGPDDKLYVPIGAPCNICNEPGYAVITRINPDGTGRETFAEGVRNTVGFTWHPETGEMWFTDNGRDWMGDDIPPDELNHAPKPGLHFGYPYCHGGDVPDPKYGNDRSCDEFAAPARQLGPHVAALGVKFYTGDMFPGDYRHDIIIVERGSWNRTIPIGYRLTRVRLEGDKAVSYEPFIEGWLQDGQSWGRPVDVLVLADGSLLVSDDTADVIYRVTYSG